MPTYHRLYYSPLCQQHQVGVGHPECPQRLQALVSFLRQQNIDPHWRWVEPQAVVREWFEFAHPSAYIERMFACLPNAGEPLVYVDKDTCWSAQSGQAVLLSGGALKEAVDWSMSEQGEGIAVSFCLNRPPGHHAERSVAMGFCIFSLLACAALYAHQHYQLERVAVLDFDVHHGNGTEDVLAPYPNLFFASTYQQGLFPEGTVEQNSAYRKVLPMPCGVTSETFRTLWEEKIFLPFMQYEPQLVFVSAGFDAHRQDPLASCTLVEGDFYFLGQRIGEVARFHQAPIVANLEGGYDLQALAKSAYAFLQGLQ